MKSCKFSCCGSFAIRYCLLLYLLGSVPSSALSANIHTSHRCTSLSMSQTEVVEASRQFFVEWAKEQAIPIASLDPFYDEKHDTWSQEDLQAIATTIGEAQVVALSEGFHNCREMLLLHHRIIRYLVEHHGFNTVVTESGLPESRTIHDYIRNKHPANGSSASTRNVMFQRGLNKMYSEWEEGRQLIEWMRQYNTQHNNEALHYYGSDIGGFYNDWKRPFEECILGCLKMIDPTFAEDLTNDMEPFLDCMSQNAGINYMEKLSPREKGRLEIILDNALQRIDSYRDKYIEKADEDEFQWARQSLESMRLAEHYYRNYLQQCEPGTSKFVGLNGREIAMHRNLLWAIEQRKRGGIVPKVIFISHVVHTKTESQYQGDLWGYFTPAGQMIKQSLGTGFCAIGMIYGGGQFWDAWQKGANVRSVAMIPPAREDGLEATLKEINPKCFYLPWKKAPTDAYPWMSSLCSVRENDYFFNLRPREWDACIFIDSVQPATAVAGNENDTSK